MYALVILAALCGQVDEFPVISNVSLFFRHDEPARAEAYRRGFEAVNLGVQFGDANAKRFLASWSLADQQGEYHHQQTLIALALVMQAEHGRRNPVSARLAQLDWLKEAPALPADTIRGLYLRVLVEQGLIEMSPKELQALPSFDKLPPR